MNDVDLTYALFNKLLPNYTKSELKLIDMTIKMFTVPTLELDEGMLVAHKQEIVLEKAALLDACGADTGDLMSNEKFAGLLMDLGVDPPRKISGTTGKETWAFAKTDEAFKELQNHDDLRVQTLVAARLGTKSTLEETRTERFIEIARRPGRGSLLPVPLQYYGAVTGRWSACVVADTMILVYDAVQGSVEKRIVDVLLDDLVWDGEAFVPHEGVVFNGFAEVITWDGITGTTDHVVFTEIGEITLHQAMQGQHRILTAESPTKHAVDAAERLTGIV